ncbi:MAG: phosphoenolpyruvate--protein phosphotransferase [Balneolaceae bacterium]
MKRTAKIPLKERTLLGKPGAGGRGVGRPVVVNSEKRVVKPEKISPEHEKRELELFKNAVRELKAEFEKLKGISDEPDVSEVVESQIQVLNDPELTRLIKAKISDKNVKAVYAIFTSFNDYIQLLEQAEADWLKDRTVDIVSIRDQLIDVVRNHQPDYIDAENAVIFAEELSPTEMIKLSRFNLAGIVTQKGGLTSHVVILAHSLGIPCVIGVEWKRMRPEEFTTVMIDGDMGSVLFEPTENLKKEYRNYEQEKAEKEKNALQWVQKRDETKCGSPFTIRGNVEFISELPKIASYGAKGIGLLRTETILFESGGFNVDTQVEFYRQVAEASLPHPVIIRLFDAGGDKLPENHEEEHNPFLGWRGIRMLLDKPELLRNQYEAILRVSGEFPGKIKILVPMISHMEQIEQAKEALKEVKHSLENEGVKFDHTIEFGIMIEVPGIAMMAGEAAQEVDFFSIGTNDLTQYMLAADRGNSKISSLYQPSHPSIWRIINRVVEASETAGIPVSVCGEMASNPMYAACFLGMGLTELSMTTNSIPGVKQMLCSHNLDEYQARAAQVLDARNCSEVDTIFQDWAKEVELQQV